MQPRAPTIAAKSQQFLDAKWEVAQLSSHSAYEGLTLSGLWPFVAKWHSAFSQSGTAELLHFFALCIASRATTLRDHRSTSQQIVHDKLICALLTSNFTSSRTLLGFRISCTISTRPSMVNSRQILIAKAATHFTLGVTPHIFFGFNVFLPTPSSIMTNRQHILGAKQNMIFYSAHPTISRMFLSKAIFVATSQPQSRPSLNDSECETVSHILYKAVLLLQPATVSIVANSQQILDTKNSSVFLA